MTIADTPAGGCSRLELRDGWAVTRSVPGEFKSPPDGGQWAPAAVPGTAAGAIDECDPDAHDWWFRIAFDAPPAGRAEEVALLLEGLATVCEVWLNGERVLTSESMFSSHRVDVSARLRSGGNELAICCRALAPLLTARRKPRARWRTKLVSSANLRFYRTMLLGRAPGFAPGPAVVGPWRPVVLERRFGGVVAEGVRVRTSMDGANGRLSFSAALRALPDASLPKCVELSVAGATASLDVAAKGAVSGVVRVPSVEPWWPHTHGSPTLHDLVVMSGDDVLHRSRVGFRSLQPAADLVSDGPALRINGEPVFCRGAVWTPPSLRAPVDPVAMWSVLRRVVDAGMNMLRVPGIGCYEDELFYESCDELGILVWQDFMFANLDYPVSDPAFMSIVESEAVSVLERLGPRPSLAVLCGGSEVAQQVAMLGLDPVLASGPLYGEMLPRVVAAADVDAPYVESAPWGGELPFRTDRGVANYYGVGAYLRPLEDARRADVRFAAECLAFANVPDEPALAASIVHDPAWKAGVPRDVGAGWDFDDVRDHYLKLLFGVDPFQLRYCDPERYLELSRAVSGEVMAETFGEWRRRASRCQGALVLWMRDLAPGAGWGVLDYRGIPKVAYHHLRRALAPVAVWAVDEGLGGIDAHVANDRAQPLSGSLRVALYRDWSVLVEEASVDVALPARASICHGVEALIGRFVDVTWAYRFGPPAQDLVALTLSDDDGRLLSQAFRFPAGRPLERLPLDSLLLAGSISVGEGGCWLLTVSCVRFAYGVRVHVDGFEPSDDAFGVEPGHERVVELLRVDDVEVPPGGTLSALNLAGSARIVLA